MRLGTTPRRAVAAAVLLAATAVAAAPSPAHANGTELVFEVVDGMLGLSSFRADATDQTTVSTTANGQSVVLSQLGSITITDNRILKMNWSYGASVPAQLEPVQSKTDRTARTGTKPATTGSEFRVAAAPTSNDGGATFSRASTWKRVDASGAAPGLVTKTFGAPSTTTFPLELQIFLPVDTPPGAYRTTVTHSVS